VEKVNNLITYVKYKYINLYIQLFLKLVRALEAMMKKYSIIMRMNYMSEIINIIF